MAYHSQLFILYISLSSTALHILTCLQAVDRCRLKYVWENGDLHVIS